MDWWIIVFVVVFMIVVGFALYGRSQRETGISRHPMEDQPGAPAAAGRQGTHVGASDQSSREDEPSTRGTDG